MLLEVVLGVVLGVLGVVYLLTPYRWHSRDTMRMVHKIPGPKLSPVIGCLFEFNLKHEELLPKIIEMHKDYGSVFRICVLGIYAVFLTDPDDIEIILNNNVHISKSLAYRFLHPWLGTGLLTSTGNKWQTRRKILTPAFHFQILDDHVTVFSANSAILVSKLAEHAGDVIDINSYVTLCTLDIICETAMGTSVNAQNGGEIEYIAAVKRMGELFQHRHLSFWLHNDLVFALSATGREQKQVLRVLHGFTEKMIKERRVEYRENRARQTLDADGRRKRLTFLDLLIEISERDGELTDKDIREEVDTFMFEGHDTTAAAISWAVFLLGHSPLVQDKAVRELDGIFQGDDRQPTMSDLLKMTYLDQVVKEVLRLYPSVPAISRTLESDVKIRGHVIPAGANVPMIPYLLHRNPDVFPDPETFDPDHFLPDRVAGRHAYAYLPFSAGPRNCIGQKFARLEEKAVLSAILRRFTVTSLDRREDVQLMMEMILRPKQGLRIKLTPRER